MRNDEDELRNLVNYYHRVILIIIKQIDWDLLNEKNEEDVLKSEQEVFFSSKEKQELKAKWDRFERSASMLKATWRGYKVFFIYIKTAKNHI